MTVLSRIILKWQIYCADKEIERRHKEVLDYRWKLHDSGKRRDQAAADKLNLLNRLHMIEEAW